MSEGDPRPEHQKSDLANCLNIVSKLNTEIDSHSIQDYLCFRNYKKLLQTSHPHPLLLKLNRSVDVTTILANRARASQGISYVLSGQIEKTVRITLTWQALEINKKSELIKRYKDLILYFIF